jgi:hypothetical protein
MDHNQSRSVLYIAVSSRQLRCVKLTQLHRQACSCYMPYCNSRETTVSGKIFRRRFIESPILNLDSSSSVSMLSPSVASTVYPISSGSNINRLGGSPQNGTTYGQRPYGLADKSAQFGLHRQAPLVPRAQRHRGQGIGWPLTNESRKWLCEAEKRRENQRNPSDSRSRKHRTKSSRPLGPVSEEVADHGRALHWLKTVLTVNLLPKYRMLTRADI